MSEFDVLEVRFHFNGEFVLDASKMLYCNGDSRVSHIEKDKISIPEFEGYLLDNTTFTRSDRMYRLPYNADLNSGMKSLGRGAAAGQSSSSQKKTSTRLVHSKKKM